MPASQSQDLSRRLLRAFAAPAGALIRHPLTTLILGLGLLVIGVIELLEGIFEEFETAVEHYHGFLLFGLITLLRGLIELVEAAEFFAINETELEETERAAIRTDPPAGGSA
ncbi:hypothetical protein [Jannaschia formosa]|uniref:hypothetical protein n=1 Tax=Jannaschia formosa TaxID=2259592 RepID=UPI000E1BDF11|nr:hypothetical protein [Jannaschia formosa]TFL16151.1 hypothetical protein DR046_21545 [Jannaschia formosa]